MEKTKIIVDTDIGSDIDDALCFAYLLNEPCCELLGVTTCSSEPEKRAEIVDSLCRYISKDIPIFVGRDMPLIGLQRQVAVHQYSVLEKLPHKTDFIKNTAISFMKETIEKYPHEVIILAIGPLTNVGALFSAYPHLASLVKEVAVMGGSFFEEGHAFLKREFNILNDAYSAEILFNSGAKITIGGLDVSLRTKTSAKEFLSKEHTGINKALALYVEKFTERTDDMYYHDAIPALYLFDKDIVKIKKGKVSIGLKDKDFAYTYFTECEDGNVNVMCDIDVERFFDRYNKIVKG